MNTNNANIDQMHLVSNLMQGYDKDDLFAEGIKSKSWKNEFFKKVQTIFYYSKKNLERGVKSFFPKIFKKALIKTKKTL